jgi:hypothetical protein
MMLDKDTVHEGVRTLGLGKRRGAVYEERDSFSVKLEGESEVGYPVLGSGGGSLTT